MPAHGGPDRSTDHGMVTSDVTYCRANGGTFQSSLGAHGR